MYKGQYLNLHTHHPSGEPGVLEIENLRFGQSPAGKTKYFSAGLHPWYLQNIDFQQAGAWLHEMAASPDCIAVGEAGLDKVTDTLWETQLAAFEHCIRVAAGSGKPLVIHCVKAYSEVLHMLKNAGQIPASVFHGYDKHPQTARMLLDAGCFLSFGAAIFRPGSHAAESLRQTPADRFFLETDDKDLDIKAVYERAAQIRGLMIEEIQDQVWQNFQNLRDKA